MNTTTLITLLLTLGVATGAEASQQKGGSKKKAPAAARATSKGTAAGPRDAFPLMFSVEGLTAGNEELVRTSLGELASAAWTCPGCSAVASAAGECPSCKKPLAQDRTASVRQVETSVEKGMVGLMVARTGRVSLTAVQETLASTHVRLDPASVALQGSATLVLAGAVAADSARVEKALVQPALFSAARVRIDEKSGRLDVDVTAGPQAPRQSAVEAALQRVGEGIHLQDVVFHMGHGPKGKAQAKGQPGAQKGKGGKKDGGGKKKGGGKQGG